MRNLLLLAFATAAISPVAVLDAPVPDGFEFASEPADEMSFEEYAELAHDSVEHVDVESATAREMTAAVDVWTAGADDILVREVTRWGDEAAAAAYVEQATVVAAAMGFEQVEPPVAGGVAYASSSAGLWTRTATWHQGPFAVTIEHFSLADDGGSIMGEAAAAVSETIERATGTEPAAVAAASAASTEPGDTSFAMLALGVAAIALSVFLIARFVRRRRHAHHDDERLDADGVGDLIERARARTRARRDVDEASFPAEFDDG